MIHTHTHTLELYTITLFFFFFVILNGLPMVFKISVNFM
jgi:hypothetical protein